MSFFLKKSKQEMQWPQISPSLPEQPRVIPGGDVQIGVNTVSNKIVVTLIDSAGHKTWVEFNAPLARRLVRTINSMIEIVDEYSVEEGHKQE